MRRDRTTEARTTKSVMHQSHSLHVPFAQTRCIRLSKEGVPQEFEESTENVLDPYVKRKLPRSARIPGEFAVASFLLFQASAALEGRHKPPTNTKKNSTSRIGKSAKPATSNGQILISTASQRRLRRLGSSGANSSCKSITGV